MAKRLPGVEIEAPLPTGSVTPLRTFAVTGIDYAGPLRQGGKYRKEELYCSIQLCDNTSCASGALSGDVERKITLSTSKVKR